MDLFRVPLAHSDLTHSDRVGSGQASILHLRVARHLCGWLWHPSSYEVIGFVSSGGSAGAGMFCAASVDRHTADNDYLLQNLY